MDITALHEAAHSVLCARLTGRGGSVSIITDGHTVGRCMLPDLHPEQELIVLLAGIAAEERVGVYDEAGAGSDVARVNHLLALHPELDINRASQTCRALVAANWSRILAVARQLESRGTMTGSAVSLAMLERRL